MYKSSCAICSGVAWLSRYFVLIDVPPKALTSWTTIVIACPVASANCTTATKSIILPVDISNLDGP